MASPTCTVNAASTLNGVDLTPASTATIALADTAGVKQWSIAAVYTDETNTIAAINATLVIDSITKTATFTVPAAGSAVIFQSQVNNGLDVNGRRDATLTTTFGIYTLTTLGFRVGAVNETTEGSVTFGWITKFNSVVRSTIPGAGAGLTYSAGNYNVGANADGSITVNANDIQVGILASDAQHGNRGGGGLHADVIAGGASGFMTGTDKTKLNTVTAGAAVASVSGTAPIVSSGGTTPAISINAASGTDPGSMSAAHYTRVNDATVLPTVGTLALRDITTGVIQANGFQATATGRATVGLVRLASSENCVYQRNAAGSADISMFSSQGDDKTHVGSEQGEGTVLHAAVNKVVDFQVNGSTSRMSVAESLVTVSNPLTVTGRLKSRTTASGGWRDLLGPYYPRGVGITIPVLTTVGASVIQMPLWQIGDLAYWYFHIPHSYAIGTDIYLHTHWLVDGVDTNTVKWQWTYYYARGYNLDAFAFGGGGTVVSVTQAPTGTAYHHMIAESTAVTVANMEPDGFLAVEIKRVTNGGTDNANNVFCWQADIHHQSIEETSGNRNGPWNT